MKNKNTLMLIAAGLLTAMPAFAEMPAAAPVASTAAKAPAQAVTSDQGIIQAVTADALTIKEAAGGARTFKLDPKVTVWQSSQKTGLQALKAGQNVTVRYQTKGGKDVAQSVEVRA